MVTLACIIFDCWTIHSVRHCELQLICFIIGPSKNVQFLHPLPQVQCSDEHKLALSEPFNEKFILGIFALSSFVSITWIIALTSEL